MEWLRFAFSRTKAAMPVPSCDHEPLAQRKSSTGTVHSTWRRGAARRQDGTDKGVATGWQARRRRTLNLELMLLETTSCTRASSCSVSEGELYGGLLRFAPRWLGWKRVGVS